MNRTTQGERGFSLVELMTAVVIFTIVGTIVTTVLVSANAGARDTVASTQTQAQLVDVMTGMSRDLSSATAVTILTPTSVSVLVQIGGPCTRSVWSQTGTDVVHTTDILDSPTCRQPAEMSVVSTRTATVARAATLTVAGYDRTNTPSTVAVDAARVAYTVRAAVQGRSNPMVLTSSTTIPRTGP